MKLNLKRKFFGANYTIGELYVDGRYECDTLEDTVRSIGNDGSGKIKGKTAIPWGYYSVRITFSPKFNCDMPLILDVPHFEGIRIHSGNTEEDTEGCILVGKNLEKGKIVQSRACFEELFRKLKAAKEAITISIE